MSYPYFTDSVIIPICLGGIYLLITIFFLKFAFKKKSEEYCRSSLIRILGIFMGLIGLFPLLFIIGLFIDIISELLK